MGLKHQKGKAGKLQSILNEAASKIEQLSDSLEGRGLTLKIARIRLKLSEVNSRISRKLQKQKPPSRKCHMICVDEYVY
jgi:hypothetical protein